MENFKIDEKELGLLGDFFTAAAKNAKQYNDFASLFDLNKSGINEPLKLFNDFYKLNTGEVPGKKSEDFTDAFESFQNLMSQYLSMFNSTDKLKIKELEERCEKLTEKLEKKENEVRVLTAFVEQSKVHVESINDVQKMFVKQGKEFQSIMEKFGFFPNIK